MYQAHEEQRSTFRLDVPLHQLLTKPISERVEFHPIGVPQRFPDPFFPQHPELLGPVEEDDGWNPPEKRRWAPGQIYHAMQGWLFPYIRSRVTPGDFHPLIAYLFTEFKCNLDCHYCWAFDNKVKGMTEDTAKRSVDWLHSTGCRVLAFMGGEPLLRPDFIHRITYYAAKKDFWIYLPTNARLLKTDVIDKLADSGMSTFNIAVAQSISRKVCPRPLLRSESNLITWFGSSTDTATRFSSTSISAATILTTFGNLPRSHTRMASPPIITSMSRHSSSRMSISSTPQTTSPTSRRMTGRQLKTPFSG
jgi:hypothetical protein